MKLIASTQLLGDYGVVAAGQEFETDDVTALHLMRNNMAKKADPPRIEYATKVIRPEEAPEVSPREPFRDVPMPHLESPQLAPESNRIVPQSVLPTSRDVNRRRRGRRSGSGS